MIGVEMRIDMKPIDRADAAWLRMAIRIGLSKAASPVKASVVAHALAIKRYGFLAKSIRIRLRYYAGNHMVAVIGPSAAYVRKKGKRKRGPSAGEPIMHRPAYVAHLVERGTYRSRAKPFLAPAFTSTKPTYAANATNHIGTEIMRRLAGPG